jgi:hypothetical protein
VSSSTHHDILSDPRNVNRALQAKVEVVTPASSVGESKVAIKKPPVLSNIQEMSFGAGGAIPGPITVTEAVDAV